MVHSMVAQCHMQLVIPKYLIEMGILLLTLLNAYMLTADSSASSLTL